MAIDDLNKRLPIPGAAGRFATPPRRASARRPTFTAIYRGPNLAYLLWRNGVNHRDYRQVWEDNQIGSRHDLVIGRPLILRKPSATDSFSRNPYV